MARNREVTREKIVEASNRLFYARGIRAVSVDAVAEKAGVTKKTLYAHFASKDDLVTAYLQSRDKPNLRLFSRWFDAAQGSLSEKIAALFTNLAITARNPKWKGCGFLRTAAELADMPGHPALKIGREHKKSLEAWLAERIAAEGRADAALRARQIVLLMDGVFSTMLVHRDPAYIECAGATAAALLDENREVVCARAQP